MSRNGRKLWLKVHLWFGLCVGPVFVLLGLTGSALVFDHAIDEWLNPELLLTEGSGSWRPFAEIVAAAEQANPGERLRAVAVSAPRVPDGVCVVWFEGGTEDAPLSTQVCVDPYTAQVTGRRIWGESLMSVVYDLHYTLLAGRPGEIIVGLGGIVLTISLGSGIVLWWPLKKASWRAGFAVRGGSRFNYDLHKIVGILGAPVLLVVAFTGVFMEFPDLAKSVVTIPSVETHPPGNLKSATSSGERSLTPEQAIAIAKECYPNASLFHFYLPRGSDGVYEVAVRQPGEVQRSYGGTLIFIDQYTGNVLSVYGPDDFTAADTFIVWQYPLHNGEAFGLVGRWIVFFSGMAPALLYITGLILWWRKRRSRSRQQERRRRCM